MFKLLLVFVASALGLLMTSSFLGIRRYLRQRRLEMPLNMAGVWLGVGTAIILALLIVCALLPRPHPEYSVTHLDFQIASPDEPEASQHSAGREGAQDPERRAQQSGSGDPEHAQQNGGSADDSADGGKSSDGESQQNGDPEGSSGSGSEGESQSGSEGRAGGEDGSDQQGGSKGRAEEQQGGSQGENAEQNEQNAESGSQSSGSDSQPSRGGQPDDETGSDSSSGESSSSASEDNPFQEVSPPESSFQPMQMLNSLLGAVPHLLRGIYYLVFIAIVAYLVWRYWDRVLPALQEFFASLRRFWESLFGGREDAEQVELEAGPDVPLRPFAAFANPFTSGAAERWSPAELVEYSFRALEAWGVERGCARDSEQTPHEYAGRLNRHDASVGREARYLADLYCRAAYSQEDVSAHNVQRLGQLWQLLERQPAEPVARL